MSAQEQLEMLLTATAFDAAGTKIGTVQQVYLDDSTGRATFVAVSTGIFSADAIIPLFGARLIDGELHLSYSKSKVKAAPQFDHAEDALTPEQELDVLEHFEIEAPPLEADATPGAAADAATGQSSAAAAGAAGKTSGRDTETEMETEKKEPAKPEPGTIPARRLAAVEDPGADKSAPEAQAGAAAAATAGAANAAATRPSDSSDEKRDAESADKADAKPQTAPKTKPVPSTEAKDKPAPTPGPQAKDETAPTSSATTEAKPGPQAKEGSEKPDTAASTSAPSTTPKENAMSSKVSPSEEKPGNATGALASKLAQTAKQAAHDDAARPHLEGTGEGTPKSDSTNQQK